ncbi:MULTISPECIES: YjcZ family sporulation protein [Bacillaceae]|nr:MULTISPECIES: YjcZ family sporulation protein [Bacillaceae]PLR67404.1 sporulation protein YjcZ [Bacillus sp. UMB0893]QNG59694.1 YjcZ family sporulation protein [Bacillus sp. PAMC26568]
MSEGYGSGRVFAFVVVIFVLLVIVGCSYSGGY